MEPKIDWILNNIKGILKEKALKVETVSSEIGISKGEFSKILSGEREQYFKYLPQISQSLGVSFHQLVTPPPHKRAQVSRKESINYYFSTTKS
jgi:transcriptional regulator with XRE-family HTH domain